MGGQVQDIVMNQKADGMAPTIQLKFSVAETTFSTFSDPGVVFSIAFCQQ